MSTVREDQEITQECYISSLEVTKEPLTLAIISHFEIDDADTQIDRLTPTKHLKEVISRPLHHQVTKLGTSLSKYK